MKNKVMILVSFLVIVIAVCICFYFVKEYHKNIVMITYEGCIQDNNYIQLAWSGLERIKNKANVQYIQNPSLEKFEETYADVISSKPNLIWSIEQSALEYTKQLAKDNKDITFINLDVKYEDLDDNLIGVLFKSYESAFLAGFAAAKVTQTNTIGFVGGKNEEVINKFEKGYTAGAKYANKDINVLVDYADTYNNKEKGKMLANLQYSNGADIIFQVAGATGFGVLDAAVENNLYAIGVDTDQGSYAPNNIIACVIKNVDVVISDLSNQFLLGELKAGINYEYGIKENGVGIVTHKYLISDTINQEISVLKEKIVSGEINVEELM